MDEVKESERDIDEDSCPSLHERQDDDSSCGSLHDPRDWSDSDSDEDTVATNPEDPYQEEEPTPDLEDPMETLNPMVETRLTPDDLIDRTFLMPPNPDGSRERAKIV